MENLKIITNQHPHSLVSEQYRKLRTNIDFLNTDKKMTVINITSTYPEEGKTLTCANLANVYAQRKQKTLIIDMDLRKPKIHRLFNVSNNTGLGDYILNDDPIHIINMNENLDIIVAGGKVPFPTDALLTSKVTNLVKELKEQYTHIIVDSPPMVVASDAMIISKLCDGTIYVVKTRSTSKDIANQCIKDLKQNNINIIGGVLTRVQSKDQMYSDKYYNDYRN